MASELEAQDFDPAKLAAAMANLKVAVGALRRQVKELQGTGSGTRPVAPKPEARAAIRQKARTGTLKPMRTPPPTGPVGPRATGRVQLEKPVSPSQELEAVDGWVSLSELAAQNESKGRGGK
jgi:hypothetical protein